MFTPSFVERNKPRTHSFVNNTSGSQPRRLFMKKGFAVVGLLCGLAVGCASMNSGDGVRKAALKSIGAEQIAWSQNAKPAGMESVVALTNMNARIDGVTLTSPTEATVLATYKYTGRFSTEAGEKAGTLTVQRRLHFTKNGTDWTASGAAEEIARSTTWSASKQA
jgi:hypothetical protein